MPLHVCGVFRGSSENMLWHIKNGMNSLVVRCASLYIHYPHVKGERATPEGELGVVEGI